MSSIRFSRLQDFNPGSVTRASQSELGVDVSQGQTLFIDELGLIRFNRNNTNSGQNAFFDLDRPSESNFSGPGEVIRKLNYSINADFTDLIGSLRAFGTNYGDIIRSGSGDDILNGDLGDDQLEGGGGNDTLNGGGGDDFLLGGDGADRLFGGAGADAMFGGFGDDLYEVDNIADFVQEFANQGRDTIRTSVNWTLGRNIENAEATGVSSVALIGNELANQLLGNGAANVLDGGAGADFMVGGAGNDRYYVDDGADRVGERAGEGSDTVYTSVDFGRTQGSENVETIVATRGGLLLEGDGGTNRLFDYATGAGTTMVGGRGDDAYHVGNGASTIVEQRNGGNDTVFASTSYALGDGQSIEVLRAAGIQGLRLTGNELGQRILGGVSDDVITGGGGADVLIGGGGNDTFVFGTTSESTSAARDQIQDFTLGDRIDLSQIVTGAGDGDFRFVEGSTRFAGTAGELIVQQRGNVAIVQGDTDGDRIADIVVSVVTGGVTLQASDFLLVA